MLCSEDLQVPDVFYISTMEEWLFQSFIVTCTVYALLSMLASGLSAPRRVSTTLYEYWLLGQEEER